MKNLWVGLNHKPARSISRLLHAPNTIEILTWRADPQSIRPGPLLLLAEKIQSEIEKYTAEDKESTK